MSSRPQPSEYEASYLKHYIDLVKDDNILQALKNQLSGALQFLSSISEEKSNHRYAEGKWSIKEVLGHICDTERIFAFRALCISRGEKQSLPGYEQNDYIANGNFNNCSFKDLVEEFRLLRESNLVMIRNFSDEMMSRSGMANGKRISVRTILFAIAGHELHHLNVIREKYLGL
jgi:uncharacterized damage-inducible protein DinB